MESQDRKPTGSSPEIELEPLWKRRMMQACLVVFFGALSVAMLMNLIFLPHILTAGTVLCFVAAGVVSFRAMGQFPKLTGGKPRPREHVRPLLVQTGRIALILVLFVGGMLLSILRGYLA